MSQDFYESAADVGYTFAGPKRTRRGGTILSADAAQSHGVSAIRLRGGPI